MKTAKQRQQITQERDAHNRRIETMRSQFRPTKDVNDEYIAHQRRIGKILGDDDQPLVGRAFRNA